MIIISRARIYTLDLAPYWLESKKHFVWSLCFSHVSSGILLDVPNIVSADSLEKCVKLVNDIRNKFEKLDINNNSNIILLSEDSKLIAISKPYSNDEWLDVRDNFSLKSFKELNITITSLKVC